MNGTRVLVADDDPSIRQLVCTIVRHERLDIDCVSDGVEAIEKLREHEYAVVMLDLMMPRIDGFGVIDWMKKHPARIKPVVLVITAYADQKFKQVDPMMVAGVLRKPFEVAELGNLVRLCVTGFDADATQRLYTPADKTIRDLAEQNVPVVDRGNAQAEN
ncbi:MAG TPA: response regulator [Thermoanaerobaculia bacterium]|jgi:CheY-like chemotaxis protein|nr:response regulator [Thermoanaerobaculia bacterium]